MVNAITMHGALNVISQLPMQRSQKHVSPKCMILESVSYLTTKRTREPIETELLTERQGRSV